MKASRLSSFLIDIYHSNLIAFVGSILEMNIDGKSNISTDSINIPMFIGRSNQVNSTGTQSI